MVLNEIAIKVPSFVFVDRTNDKFTWNEDIQNFVLTCLNSACNKHLMPNILCSWRCTGYNHK